MIGSSAQNGWGLEKLGPVGGLTAVALGEPLRSRLSGSWERPGNTDKLGVGKCEKTWLMLPAEQEEEGVMRDRVSDSKGCSSSPEPGQDANLLPAQEPAWVSRSALRLRCSE